MSNIEQYSDLLYLRGLLNKVSETSYSYNVLYKKYPISELKEEEVKSLITAYRSLIEQLLVVLKEYK